MRSPRRVGLFGGVLIAGLLGIARAALAQSQTSFTANDKICTPREQPVIRDTCGSSPETMNAPKARGARGPAQGAPAGADNSPSVGNPNPGTDGGAARPEGGKTKGEKKGDNGGGNGGSDGSPNGRDDSGR